MAAEDCGSETLVYTDSSGRKVLNWALLKSVVETEGFALKKASTLSASEESVALSDDKVVLFYTPEEMALTVSSSGERNDASDDLGGLMVDSSTNMFAIRATMGESLSKQIVIQWLSGCHECVVCFEETMGRSLKELRVGCKCGVVLCFACDIDLLRSSETEMTKACPNCRAVLYPLNNWLTLLGNLLTADRIVRKIEGMTEAQLDFIDDIMGTDLRRRWPQYGDFPKLPAFMSFMRRKMSRKLDSKVNFELYKKGRAAMRGPMRRKKKGVATASAKHIGSSPMATRTTQGCANCGKSFWDKSEWKRAPKCTKCKRVAYCNAKCRKKHWKKHSAECKAMAQKTSKTKKKKKTKKACSAAE